MRQPQLLAQSSCRKQLEKGTKCDASAWILEKCTRWGPWSSRFLFLSTFRWKQWFHWAGKQRSESRATIVARGLQGRVAASREWEVSTSAQRWPRDFGQMSRCTWAGWEAPEPDRGAGGWALCAAWTFQKPFRTGTFASSTKSPCVPLGLKTPLPRKKATLVLDYVLS